MVFVILLGIIMNDNNKLNEELLNMTELDLFEEQQGNEIITEYQDKINNTCTQQREYYYQALDALKLYEIVPNKINFSIDGLAWSNKNIYCVHMSSDDIERTDLHEQCHIVVYNYPGHFCKVDKWQ